MNIIFRYNHIPKLNIAVNDLDSLQNDTIVLGIKNEVAELEKYTNKIIFFEPNPVIVKSTFKRPADLARVLTFNHSLSSLDSFTLPREAVEKSLAPSWTRIRTAISDCKKCVIIPTLDLFCEEKKCPIAEPSGLSRYCDTAHVSVIGANRTIPALKNILKDLL